MGELSVRLFRVDNGEGWKLALRRHVDPDALDTHRRPVAILPGYGMNGFIFTYHPEGPSMAETFARAGFEFWTVDLRAQGDSLPDGGASSYRLEDAGLTDLRCVLRFIERHTASTRPLVDVIGCSLGATYAFMHVALEPEHRVAALVSIGGPLRYQRIHPAVRAAFSSPTLAGMVPFWGTSLMAELALPLVAGRAPWLLRLYLRAENVDLDKAQVLVRTVEDPVPAVNEQIARWLKDKDLVVDGRNVTGEFHRFGGPFFCLYGNADGIVPQDTAMTAFTHTGSAIREVMALGDDRIKMAHADPYVSRYSHDALFRPMIDWLSSDPVRGYKR